MPTEMKVDFGAALDAIEARLERRDPAKEIAPELRVLMETIPDDSPHRPRALRLRGIVFNRLRDPKKALAFLHQARQAAIDQQNLAEIVRAGREIAVVHAWRGEDRDGALALLRAVAAAHLQNDDAAATLALAEVGRIELEARRFDEAARLFSLMADRDPQPLEPYQVFRIQINLCQALNRLDKHEEVLKLTKSLVEDPTAYNKRLIFLILLEEARGYAGMEDFPAAANSLGIARGLLPPDENEFEHDEYREAEAEIGVARGESSAIEDLKTLADKYADPSLTVRAANLRMMAAQVLFNTNKAAEAVGLLADALRDAVKRGLPDLAGRIRSEMLQGEGGTHLDAVLKDVGAIDAIGGEWSIERQLIRLDTIGKGGGGQVYRAIDMRDGQEVAVKEVSIAAYSEEVRRQIVESVRNEYAVAVALPKNSGIANVRGLLSDPDGTLYLVQDLIKGTSLAKLYTPEPAPARLLPLLVDVADALATLHANHIVHRDLKPDNVMVRRGSARDEAVLIDFGIALLDGQPDTLKFYGTAGYMAPEQARGEKADARADIYSLGKMIAQVWGSDEPPVAASKLAILWRGEGQSAMPEPLAGIVRQMLASDREKRPELGIVRSALEGCQASKA